jgi:Tfp pilus assembly protein PilF
VPDSFPAWLRLADLALQENRLDDANKALSVVLKAKPDDTTALILRARIHLAKHETKQAIETASKAVKLDARLPQAHHVLALAQLQSGNPALARSSAKAALARAPFFPDYVLLASQLALQADDTQSAIDDLKKYLEKVPEDPRAWLELGTAFLRGKDVVRATEAFSRAATLAPKDARPHFYLGIVYRTQNKPAEARKQFETALQFQPRFADALIQLADMSYAEKKPEAALERINRQVAADPTSPELTFVLARTLEVHGDRERAEKEYRRVIELNPNFSGAYVQLAGMYGEAKEYERGQQMLEKALATDPENLGALMLLSITQDARGDKAKAREGYEKLLAKQPKFAPAANNLAWMLADEGKDLERAQSLAQIARETAPEDPNVADTLGWVLYKQRAYLAALALFKESAAKLPDNPEIQLHLGLAQYKVGDTAGAQETLKKVLAANPNLPGAEEARAILSSK